MSLSFSQDNPCQAPSVAHARTAQDIHSMAATLTSYDHLFGPHHPQTLTVMVHLGRPSGMPVTRSAAECYWNEPRTA